MRTYCKYINTNKLYILILKKNPLKIHYFLLIDYLLIENTLLWLPTYINHDLQKFLRIFTNLILQRFHLVYKIKIYTGCHLLSLTSSSFLKRKFRGMLPIAKKYISDVILHYIKSNLGHNICFCKSKEL